MEKNEDLVQESYDMSEEFIVETQKPKKNSNPPYLLILLLMVVSFFAGYLYYKTTTLQKQLTEAQKAVAQGGAGGQQVAQTVDEETVKSLFTDEYIHFGNADRNVLFVEISDPSCPYCHIAGGNNPELSAQVGPNFAYESSGGTYRPPVTEMRKLVEEGKASYVTLFGNGHGNGFLAMEALYCAHEKGNFWDAHDRLMSNEGYSMINDTIQNDRSKVPQLAEFLAGQVDSTFLTECLNSEKYQERVTRDESMGATLAFQGTPHFIINTTIFGGAQNYADMESTVNDLL